MLEGCVHTARACQPEANSVSGSQDCLSLFEDLRCVQGHQTAAEVLAIESWPDKALAIPTCLNSLLHHCLRNVPLCTVFRGELSHPVWCDPAIGRKTGVHV